MMINLISGAKAINSRMKILMKIKFGGERKIDSQSTKK